MDIGNGYLSPIVVAEIGCNHMGQFELALELIDLAKLAGIEYVKFQKRTNRELLTPEQYNAPHPVYYNAYGNTYGAHREHLEFSLEQHAELKRYCESLKMVYSTSVWDVTSARQITALNPEFIKVPSACNMHFELLRILRDDYDGQVQLSTGMTTKAEVETIVQFFEETDSARTRLLLYACTSGYPVPASDMALLEIRHLQEIYGERIAEIGFSGHHLGIALDVAAYTLGARWIERHFTKDRTWKGTDHAASLEPQGLQKLARDLKSTYTALRYKDTGILPIEEVQREKLKYKPH